MDQDFSVEPRFRFFFTALFLTTALPYSSYILPVIPPTIFGFNLTGWAWMTMFLITVLLLYDTKNIVFPVFFWIPWVAYLVIYLITDYSFLGFQLTLQYLLPVLIGLVASGFSYNRDNLEWLLKMFIRLCGAIYFLFVFGYFFRNGNTPSPSSTPMLYSLLFSFLAGLFFMTKEKKYLFFAGLLLLVSLLGMRRMAIAATASIFILHFANQNLRSKILYGFLAGIVLLLIFNSRRFQEETFYNGNGKISDLELNYYDNKKIRSSGRQSWKIALAPGLQKAPVWGNGPRADNEPIIKITGGTYGEAHNDYLAVRYNYGYVGLAFLLAGFFLNFISLFKIYRRNMGNDFIFLISTSVLPLFFCFLMFMYTDNILKYTIFFPNYFFALIGIVYSLERHENIRSYTIIQ